MANVLNLNDRSTPSPVAVRRHALCGRETSSVTAGPRATASAPGAKVGVIVVIGARWGRSTRAGMEAMMGRVLSMIWRFAG